MLIKGHLQCFLRLSSRIHVSNRNHSSLCNFRNIFIRSLHERYSVLPSLKKTLQPSFINYKNLNTIGRKLKTHNCGELTSLNVGEHVTLRGFLVYKRYGKFIFIRDCYGSTQAIIKDDDVTFRDDIEATTYDSYVEISGVVLLRPPEQHNKKTSTGEIEVLIDSYKVLNKASKNIPFFSKGKIKSSESLRMKYRYLDLRSDEMQNILRLRSTTGKKIRDYLQDEMGFTEVTTPTLSVNTPGGAQEYVVPTQTPNQFYSLVQSPQTFKQLTMLGGIDRYFQFAVCYRDESFRADRQPEFMQVDIEMSDITVQDMKELTEGLVRACWPAHLPSLPEEFPTHPYDEIFNNYGTDKPDTRFDWRIQDVTSILGESDINIYKDVLSSKNNSIKAFVIPQGMKYLSKKIIDKWGKTAREENNLGGINVFHVTEGGLKGGVSKYLPSSLMSSLIDAFQANIGDSIIVSAGNTNQALNILGKLRILGAQLLEEKGLMVRDPDAFSLLWVTDFPMFEEDGTGKLCSVHHPFTRPIDEHMDLVYTDPVKVKSQHYDLVLNGSEIAGGSIRIHEPLLQEHVLSLLNIDPSDLGFLSEALTYGAPPHGGIAMGFDRFIAILCNKENIREVIAFPKSSTGRCLMTGAPSNISTNEKKLYNLNLQ